MLSKNRILTKDNGLVQATNGLIDLGVQDVPLAQAAIGPRVIRPAKGIL
jgi:hypothetical protein